MELLWKQKITLPYPNKLFKVVSYDIDNDGNVALIGKLFKDKAVARVNGMPNYEYRILSYQKEGEILVEYPVKLNDKFVTNLRVAIDDNKDIICAGFYSERGSFSIAGSFFLKIDHKTKDIISESYKKFDISFITQNMTERQEDKTRKKITSGKQVEMYNYDLDHIILKDDGGAVLVAEQFYIKTVIHSSGSSSYMTTNYYYNDIIVVNINKEGDINWATKIAKRQNSFDDGGQWSSYAMMIKDNQLFFVFNDNPRNLFYKGKGKVAYTVFSGKNAITVLVELTDEGKQTREVLFNKVEVGVLIQPKFCEQISNNEMVLYGRKGTTQKFAKLIFKD